MLNIKPLLIFMRIAGTNSTTAQQSTLQSKNNRRVMNNQSLVLFSASFGSLNQFLVGTLPGRNSGTRVKKTKEELSCLSCVMNQEILHTFFCKYLLSICFSVSFHPWPSVSIILSIWLLLQDGVDKASLTVSFSISGCLYPNCLGIGVEYYCQ